MDHSTTIGSVPPGIIGTVVKKNNKDLGISFHDHPTENNVVYIHKLKGKFRKETMLASGLRVTHVNGLIVFKASEAMKLIQKTPIGGSVQVIASGKLIEMRKPKSSRFILKPSSSSSSSSPSSSPSAPPLGIHLRPLPGRIGLVQITRVDNLLTDIPVGHLLVAVNKKPVTSVKKAHWYLKMCYSQRVKLITAPEQSFSCVFHHQSNKKGVVMMDYNNSKEETAETKDYDSVNAFHPNLMNEEEKKEEKDPFFSPLSSAWQPSLEQQLCQLQLEHGQEKEESDTVWNHQYESDINLHQYRIRRRRQDSSSTTQSYPYSPSLSHEEQQLHRPIRSKIMQSIPTDENGDFIFEDDDVEEEEDDPPIMLMRLPSSFMEKNNNKQLEPSERSLSSSKELSSMASISEAPSGLPDMILNLQTQNDFMEEAMGSFRSGRDNNNNTTKNHPFYTLQEDNDNNNNNNTNHDMVPFIFIDSGSECDDLLSSCQEEMEEEEEEDLKAFLNKKESSQPQQQEQPPQLPSYVPATTMESHHHQQQQQQQDGEKKKKNIIQQTTTPPRRNNNNNHANKHSPLRDKTNNNNNKSPTYYSPSFFDKKTSALFQSVEKAKKSGENNNKHLHPSRRRQDMPALLDTASRASKNTLQEEEEDEVEEQDKPTTTTTTATTATKIGVQTQVCLPVHMMDTNNNTTTTTEELQSYLTEEEEKVDYVLQLIEPITAAVEEKREEESKEHTTPKRKAKFSFSLPASPFKVKHNMRHYQEVPWCIPMEEHEKEEEKEVLGVEETKQECDDDEEEEAVGEMRNDDDESLLAKGLHFLQAIAADATTCMSPSRKYHPNRQQYQHKVYAM